MTSAGQTDIVVARYDDGRELQWLARAGGTQGEQVAGMALLADDSVVVVGTFSGTATFGQGEPRQTTLTAAGAGAELFIARFSPNGQLAWVKRLSSNNLTGSILVSAGVAATPDGALVVAGSFLRQTVFGAGEINQTTLCAENNCASGGLDAFVARYEVDGTLAWAKRAGGNFGDGARVVAVAADGTIYISGTHSQAAVFGFGEANPVTVRSSGSGDDVFVAAYAPGGALLWAKNAVEGTGAGTFAISETLAVGGGTLVLGGRFQGTVVVGGAGAPTFTLSAAGSDDGWVASFASADGSARWAKKVSGMQADAVYAVAVLDDGTVAVGGSCQGNAVFDGQALASLGSIDTFIARVSSTGTVLELDRSAGSGPGEAVSLVALVPQPDGTVWLAGSYLGSITFGMGDQNAVRLRAPGGRDGYAVPWVPVTWRLWSYEPVGLGWAFAGGGASDDAAKKVVSLPDGRVVAAGSYTSVPVTFGSTTLSVSASDVFVVSLSSAGGFEWATKIGGSGQEDVGGLVGHADGTVTVVGTFTSTLTLGATTLTSTGQDVFLAHLSATGSVLWAKRVGGSSMSVGGASGLPGGGFMVAGTFAGTASFGPGESAATALASSMGSNDVFVAQYAADGRLRWARRSGGSDDDQALSVSSLPDGSSFVTGYFTGAATFGIGDPSPITLTGGASNDLFLVRFSPAGAVVHAKRAGGDRGPTMGIAVAAVPDGSAWVLAEVPQGGPHTYDPTLPAGLPLTAGLVAARYRPDGNLDVARNFVAGPEALLTFTDGSALIGGRFSGALTGGYALQTTYFTSMGRADGFAMRLNGIGQASVWRQAISSTNLGDDAVNAVCHAQGGSVAVSGSFAEAVTLGSGEANAVSLMGTRGTAFVAKYWKPTP